MEKEAGIVRLKKHFKMSLKFQAPKWKEYSLGEF